MSQIKAIIINNNNNNNNNDNDNDNNNNNNNIFWNMFLHFLLALNKFVLLEKHTASHQANWIRGLTVLQIWSYQNFV